MIRRNACLRASILTSFVDAKDLEDWPVIPVHDVEGQETKRQ